jgi:hypothetical protein
MYLLLKIKNMNIKRIRTWLVLGMGFGLALIVWRQTPLNLPVPVTTMADNLQRGTAALIGHPVVSREIPVVQSAGSGTAASIGTQPQASVNTVRRQVTIGDKLYPLRTYKPQLMPNDPSANQWWVAQTKMDLAWDVPAGAKQTTLAIIDSGFALQHEEFANRWYANNGESGTAASEAVSSLNCSARSLPVSASCNLRDDDYDGIVDNETGAAAHENPSRLNCSDQGRALDKGCNRIDDDGNGYIDDSRGWDFSNNDNLPQAGEYNPAGAGTTHGTRTAGIAAATGNNGKGMAGADWNTKILPIQALDDDSYGDTLSVGRSIYYAINRGADVISLSLGSDAPDDYVRQAVDAALAAGIIVVAASGNDGCDCIVYPANYPETVAVGALNASSQPATFSSYGANLDILAPGVNMTSADWQSTNQTTSYVSGINGTSFATPMVAGMLSRLKSRQPAATPAQLYAALTENVNRLGLTVPRDARLGFGALNASAAVNRMVAPNAGQSVNAFTPVSKGNKLMPGTPVEPINGALVYDCTPGITGTTPIHELTKSGAQFFSMSEVEKQLAVNQGYGSGLLAYVCLAQPHDTPVVMHAINIYREFRNINDKQP